MASPYWNKMAPARKALAAKQRRDPGWLGKKLVAKTYSYGRHSKRCQPRDDYFLGNAIDWDTSWLQFDDMPWHVAGGIGRKRDYFTTYLHPDNYFYACQAYVREARRNKPGRNAPPRQKLMWMTDVLSRINDGLYASNLSASVLVELMGIRIAIDGKDYFVAMPAIQNHPMWKYVDKVWAAAGVRSRGVDSEKRVAATMPFNMFVNGASPDPLVVARLDLMRLPAVTTSDILQAMYGPIARQVTAHRLGRGRQGGPCVYDVKSWTMSDRISAGYMPWLKGNAQAQQTYYRKEEAKKRGVSWRTVLATEAQGSTQLSAAILDSEMWMWPFHSDVAHCTKYGDTGGLSGDRSEICEQWDFRPRPRMSLRGLEAFSKSSDWNAGVVQTKDYAGNDAWMPNVGFVFQHGVDVWIDLFLHVGDYRQFVAAGADTWGKMARARNPDVGIPIPFTDMTRMWREGGKGVPTTVGQIGFAAATTAQATIAGAMPVVLGTGTAASASATATAEAIATGATASEAATAGTTAASAAAAATGVLIAAGAMMALLGAMLKIGAAKTLRRKLRQELMRRYVVIDQLFRRFSTKGHTDGIRKPDIDAKCLASVICYLDPNVGVRPFEGDANNMFKRVVMVAANALEQIPSPTVRKEQTALAELATMMRTTATKGFPYKWLDVDKAKFVWLNWDGHVLFTKLVKDKQARLKFDKFQPLLLLKSQQRFYLQPCANCNFRERFGGLLF